MSDGSFHGAKATGASKVVEEKKEEAMKRFNPYRSIECLEQKRMNAADLVGGMLDAMPAGSNTVQTAGTAAGSVDGSAGAPGQNVNGASHLSGALSGTGQGTLNLVSGNNGRANLVLRVSGAPAGQTLDVSIDGNVVGSLSTNARGNGILHLNGALNNAGALLDLLPSITANSSVSVGVSGQTPILTGTLQSAVNGNVGVGATSAVNGVLNGVANLGNVTTNLNSIVNNLNSQAGNAVGNLLSTVNRIDNVANQLVGKVENLTAATVDKLFGDTAVSDLLDQVYGLVPVNSETNV